jgi:hypothetical protein
MEDAAPHLAHFIILIIEGVFGKDAIWALLPWLAILFGTCFAGFMTRELALEWRDAAPKRFPWTSLCVNLAIWGVLAAIVAWMLFGPDLRSLDQQIESFKGQITRDENAPGKPITGISFHRREFDFSFSSHSSRGFCDGDLATLRPSLEGLSELRDLDLAGTEITDQGLRHLKSLTQLKTLRAWALPGQSLRH